MNIGGTQWGVGGANNGKYTHTYTHRVSLVIHRPRMDGASGNGASGFGGMEWWNGIVEWNGLVEYWNTGIDVLHCMLERNVLRMKSGAHNLY